MIMEVLPKIERKIQTYIGLDKANDLNTLNTPIFT